MVTERTHVRPWVAAAAGVLIVAATVSCGGAPAAPAGTSAPSAQAASPTPGASAATTRPIGSPVDFPTVPDEIMAAGSCHPGQMDAPACVTREIAAWRGVPFTPASSCPAGATGCQFLMDVFAPTQGGPWPLIVIVPGGNQPPNQVVSYTDDFGLALANRGAVVMTANWKSQADVACAVGVARATGPDYEADPTRLVLVGHSAGATPVSVLGLTATPVIDAAACDETSGALRPDAIAVIAGTYPTAAMTLDASDSPDAHIPILIAQGGKDDPSVVTAARSFKTLLTSKGWDSTLVEVPTADHPGILYERATIDAIMALTDQPSGAVEPHLPIGASTGFASCY